MSVPRRLLSAVVRHCLRPLGEGLMTIGGFDFHRYEEALSAYRESGYLPPLLPLPYGPPPGHPERLRPDLPLSHQETALLRQLVPNRTGGRT
ncbi:DUF6059 family protein [Kitasatospora sp. NPDC101183]|uniref:DUF6059 family protein n=1 Tax=Kitasatospora sp. NPDC101183 TaxID=3364100 RepID=UPI003815FB6B